MPSNKINQAGRFGDIRLDEVRPEALPAARGLTVTTVLALLPE